MNRIVFFIALFVCVFFIGCGGSDEHDEYPFERNIKFSDVTVEYDGEPHYIFPSGMLDGDLIYYSSDGVDWSGNPPEFVEVGAYDIYLKLENAGETVFTGKAILTITRTALTDIALHDIKYIYDGSAHSVPVSGLLSSDEITYTINGKESRTPSFTDCGVYDITVHIERKRVGYFDGSCRVEIVPDYSATYLNKTGIVTVDGFELVIAGRSVKIDYDHTGVGNTDDGEAIRLYSDKLVFSGVEYDKLGDGDRIYSVEYADNTYYIKGGESVTVRAETTYDGVDVFCGDEKIFRANGVNYCESINGEPTRDLLVGTAECSVSSVSTVTKIVVEFSERPSVAFSPETDIVIYDGLPHSLDIDFDGDLYYVNGKTYSTVAPSFTNTGVYEFSVIAADGEHLPTLIEVTITIAPDLSGVYYGESGIIRIDKESVEINGATASFEPTANGGNIDGVPIVIKDGGIEIGDKSYTENSSDRLVALLINGRYEYFSYAGYDALFIVNNAGGGLTVRDGENNVIFESAFSGVAAKCSVWLGDLVYTDDGFVLVPAECVNGDHSGDIITVTVIAEHEEVKNMSGEV